MENRECAQGAKHETKIIDLERRMSDVEKAILDIRDKLLGRPSWGVVVIVTFLSSLSVGLLVIVLKNITP